ncbi:MAG: response regulator [Acidobacteriia bacterium]|nr:response regulator [Terriglobia bacterium]
MRVFRDAKPRVLIVDDEDAVRTLLSEFLGSRGFETAQAANAEEALEALSRQPFDLALSDIQMPGRNGISLLAEIRRRRPEVAVNAMKTGASDYVLKPFNLDRVEQAVREALQRRAELQEQAEQRGRLETMVREQTAQLRTLLADLDEASENTLEALVAALDAREHETTAHSRRVAEYAVRLAEELGVRGEALENIRRGAMLHDIGKIGISDTILLKPARLTDAEWAEMRRHPQIGYWILNGIESLRPAAEIVLAHHERFDGRGYPRGLKGEEIPLGARVFSVADTLDAITSDRPYQRGHSFESARQEIALNAGRQFDPAVVDRFLRIPPRLWEEIREKTLSDGGHAAENIPPLILEPCRPDNQ